MDGSVADARNSLGLRLLLCVEESLLCMFRRRSEEMDDILTDELAQNVCEWNCWAFWMI
jgi:hypothetical protein